MSYKPNYEGGWKSGEAGGTPITPEALNHIEQGIEQAYSDFAPSGYGLGENGAYVSDLDTLKTTGVFTFTHDATSNPFPGWGGIALVLASKTTIKQILFCNKNNGLCVERSMYLDMDKTTFEPWEYRNPPFDPGVEYRTTERWDKKPVYAMLINCGTAKDNAEVTVYNATKILRHNGTFNTLSMPVGNYNGYHAYSSVSDVGHKIVMHTDSKTDGLGHWGAPWMEQVWYIKD